jgi:hypothetical protein
MPTLTPEPLRLTLALPAAVLDRSLVRERIMRRVGARLARIRVANGYQTDLAQALYYGALIEAEPPALPALNYYDGDEEGEALYGVREKRVELTIEAYDKVPDATTETLPDHLSRVSGRMLGDIEVALVTGPTGTPEPTFGGLAAGLQYASSRLIIGTRPQLWVGCVSNWIITYRTRHGNPYTTVED